MNYMYDRLELLANKQAIYNSADAIFDILINDENLDDSERLMAIELAMAKVNYKLYNISGDGEKGE